MGLDLSHPEGELGSVQVRAGVGWQYALADLSMILFLVTASALARQDGAPAPPPAPRPPVAAAARPQPDVVALADPVAVWRAGPGGPSLREWLAGQALDPRQRLTIVARYSNGRAQEAFARAERAMSGLDRLPSSARMVVEPAGVDDLSATLTWDASAGGVAQPLH